MQKVLIYTVSILVPTAPPQNVVVQSSTATQLDVTWDPPPLDAQNGDIQGYKVLIMYLFKSCHKSTQLTSYFLFFQYIFIGKKQKSNEFCILNSLILFIDLFLGVSAPE